MMTCAQAGVRVRAHSYLVLTDPVVVLEPDTSLVLHECSPRLTTMRRPLPCRWRSLELTIGLDDDDRLRVVQDHAAHGSSCRSAMVTSASATSCDHRQYNPKPARLGAPCCFAHAG